MSFYYNIPISRSMPVSMPVSISKTFYRGFFNLPDQLLNNVCSKSPIGNTSKSPIGHNFMVADASIKQVTNVSNVLDLFGLKFEFDGLCYKPIVWTYTPTELLKIGSEISDCFNAVNHKGYIPPKLKENPMLSKIKQHLKHVGFKTSITDFGASANTYTLWFNFITINLLFVISKELVELRLNTFDNSVLDTIDNLESLRTSLISSLDPYLRVQFQKRGITIIQNTYCGFDTEYELKSFQKCLNTLISAQTAVQTRTLIKLPLYLRYDISYVNPLTSEITTYFKPKNVE